MTGSVPVFERTGHEPRYLKRTIDFYPILEDAFLRDLVSKMSSRYPVYHAAVLAKNGEATIFLGEPNAGKSTLCAESVKNGWTYLSDEMAAVDRDEVIALPRPISFNDLENPARIMPFGDRRFEELGYDFFDKKGIVRRTHCFLPRPMLAAQAGERFPIKKVVWLESIENGPPIHHILSGAEMRGRLALNRLSG